MSNRTQSFIKAAVLLALVFVACFVASEVAKPEVSITEVMTYENDYVILKNNRPWPIDLTGYIFTDGDNQYTFKVENDNTLECGEEGQLAKGKLDDHTKGDGKKDFPGKTWRWINPKKQKEKEKKEGKPLKVWGLSEDGEIAALLTRNGKNVVDFVITGPRTTPLLRGDSPELSAQQSLLILFQGIMGLAWFAGLVSHYVNIWRLFGLPGRPKEEGV